MIQIETVGHLALHELLEEVIEKTKEGYVLGKKEDNDQYARKTGNYSYMARMYKPEELVELKQIKDENEFPLLEELNGLSKKEELFAFCEKYSIEVSAEDAKYPTKFKKILIDIVKKNHNAILDAYTSGTTQEDNESSEDEADDWSDDDDAANDENKDDESDDWEDEDSDLEEEETSEEENKDEV